RDEGGVLEAAAADREVDPLLDEIDAPAGQDHLEDQARVAGQYRRDDTGQVLEAEIVRRGDAHEPVRLAGEAGHLEIVFPCRDRRERREKPLTLSARSF